MIIILKSSRTSSFFTSSRILVLSFGSIHSWPVLDVHVLDLHGISCLVCCGFDRRRTFGMMASEQSKDAEQKLEQFFHHGKTEHAPTDTEMGKKPARPWGIRQAEHQEKQEEEKHQHPLLQPKERRVKDAEKQADQYGRETTFAQTLPQTLLDEQDPFGASSDSTAAKESREKVTLFPTAVPPADND